MLPCAEYENLDVGLSDTGDSSGFFRRHVFTEAEPHDFKLALRQDAAGAIPEAFRVVVLLRLVCRGNSVARERVGERLPSFGGAKMIEGRPPRDRQEPVDQGPGGVEAVKILERFDEGLLGQIFGVLTLARHMEKEVEDAGSVESDDF